MTGIAVTLAVLAAQRRIARPAEISAPPQRPEPASPDRVCVTFGELLAVAQAFDDKGVLIGEQVTTLQIDHDWKIVGESYITVEREAWERVFVAEVRLLDLAGNVRSSETNCGDAFGGARIHATWNLELIPKIRRGEQ